MVNCQDNEYVCHTCVVNIDLTNVIAFEQTHVTSYLPIEIRRTIKVGTVFTKNSYLFEYHIKHGLKHDWGKYQ